MKRWIIPLFNFFLELSVRIWNLSGYITIDEPRWIERSAIFINALTDSDYQCPPEQEGRRYHAMGLECTHQSGHPAIITTSTASLGLLTHYIWVVKLDGIDLSTHLSRIKQRTLNPSFIVPARVVGAIINVLFVPFFTCWYSVSFHGDWY